VKEQLLSTHAAQLEQAGAQRKSFEDSLAMYKQQVDVLDEKFAMSVQEINKGNQIIQKLRTDSKQLKAKLRLKADALTQQEKSVHDLERAGENGRHAVVEKEQELCRSKEREERSRQDNEALKKQLAESHEVLKRNQDVIEYLNRQIAERDLKSMPPLLPTGSAGLDRETRNSPLSDLLKRTEGLGNNMKAHGVTSFANNIGLSSTGLSELGLGSGLSGLNISGNSDTSSNLLTRGSLNTNFASTSPGAFTSARKGAEIYGLAGAGGSPSGFDSKDVLGSSPMSLAGLGVGRAALQGPVAYRTPTSSPPLAVK